MKKTNMKVEALDQTMYLAECSSDQQINCYMEFDGKIRADLLQNSIEQTIRLEKILSYNIKRTFFNLYWNKLEENIVNKILLIKNCSGDVQRLVNEFMAEKIDIRVNPMLKILLLRTETQDFLVFKAHHVLADASGFTNYIRLVISIYNKLIKDNSYIRPDYKVYHRSIQPIKERYTKGERFKIILSSTKVKVKEKIYSFPWNREEKEDDIYFVKHIIKRQNVERILQYCMQKGFTLNDFLCAVYYKTYYSYRNELLNIKTKYNPFFLTLDLRNYCRPKNNNALFNYSTGLLLQYYINPENDIETIINQFKEKTVDLKIDFKDYSKNKIPGINTVFLLEKVLKIMPFELIFKGCYMKREEVGCVPGFGNAGNLEQIVDQWADIKVKNAYLTGGLGFCMGAFGFSSSSYYDEVLFSMNFYGNQKNMEFVKEFFKRFDSVFKDMSIVENETMIQKIN